MKELHTTTLIDAPPERVFQIVTDIARYHEWNPLVVSARGTVAVGRRLDVVLRVPGQRSQPYVVKVLRVVSNRELVWLGHMKVPGILDGTHFFELYPEGPNQVRLVHREEFRGVLVPLVWRAFLNTRMREGFESLNQSLKALAENASWNRFGAPARAETEVLERVGVDSPPVPAPSPA